MKYWCVLLLTLFLPFATWANDCSVTVGSMDIAQSVPDKVSIGEEYINTVTLRARTSVRRVEAIIFLIGIIVANVPEGLLATVTVSF